MVQGTQIHELLIDFSIILDWKNCLHYAIKQGNVNIIKTLLNKGCDPNIQDKVI